MANGYNPTPALAGSEGGEDMESGEQLGWHGDMKSAQETIQRSRVLDADLLFSQLSPEWCMCLSRTAQKQVIDIDCQKQFGFREEERAGVVLNRNTTTPFQC